MTRATDAHILEAARQRQAVVVTLDSDFHVLLATSRVQNSKPGPWSLSQPIGFAFVDSRSAHNRRVPVAACLPLSFRTQGKGGQAAHGTQKSIPGTRRPCQNATVGLAPAER